MTDLNVFNNKYLIPFIISIASGIFIIWITGLTKYLKSLLQGFQYQAGRFSINGYWIANFSFEKSNIYEFIRVIEKREQVLINYQSFWPSELNMVRYTGRAIGVYRAGYIFAPYVPKNGFTGQVGAYILRRYHLDKCLTLSGYFVQSHGEKSSSGFCQGKLAFAPVQLPFSKMISFIFNRALFHSFQELTDFLKIERTKISIDWSNQAREQIDDL